ncbi:Adenylate cyclase 1 [Aquicella siphonis]|uniref:Adenylate cyclase 1 n=1 Tax=Aquicella siphonis TaxID=254247 RepID=A0A5E4PLT7_9COXI|nr:GAF domain-containing protein [Aquicella siphonis]VVC77186.1 Adenylate cyclase 1 [Aquicella siphonis]
MQNEMVVKNLKSKSYYRLLSQIYRDVAKTSTLKEALTTLVNVTTCVIGCERGSVFLNDEKTGELYSFIAQGDLHHEIRVLNTSGLVGWSYTHNEAVCVKDAYKDERYNRVIDQITGFRTKSVLCVPLKSVNNELIGVTQMLNKIGDEFTETDIQLVKALTEQAALAIQSKLTIEHIEAAHKKELEFLEAMSRVSAEIQLSSLLEKIIATITKALDAERSTLFINDSKSNELYTEASIGLEKKEIRFPNHLGIAGAVFTTGEIINIPHAYADLRFNPSFDKMTGFFTRSILTAPVKNKAGHVIGVTQVLNKKHGEFNEDDESQLVAINTQISMAIENAKLFDDVQNIKNYNESILESMSNGVLTINENNNIVTCNKAGMRILEISSLSDILNKDATILFSGPNNLLSEKIMQLNRSTDQVQQEVMLDAEISFRNKTVVANITIMPLLSIKQQRLGIMIMIEDISSEKRMKSTMSRYMSPDLADQLLKSSEFSLGGTSTVATILFSDIRNFTTISESLGAEQTVKLLNDYFTLMVDCIHNEGGMLDKFIGDAIMAVYGTPFPHEDDPDRAVRTAIAMMKALQKFNKKRSKNNLITINHGIGINTDKVVSGNIGSEKRMDFTVIGDGVNLASRIEGLCKQYGAQLLISEFTYKKLKATYRTRQIDKVIVKGKGRPVQIYEVIDFYDSETFPNQIEVLGHFNNGIEYYNRGDWNKAIDCFESALKLHPDDKPSVVYLERCRKLRKNPPVQDWNGVWIMEQK